MSALRPPASFSRSAVSAERRENVWINCAPSAANSDSWTVEFTYFAVGGNARYPVVCSAWKCVVAMKISRFAPIFATSRRTVSPLRRPSPGTITSVAREPITMPTFGTSGTLPSGMTKGWAATFTVAFSFTSGSGTAAGCATAVAAANRHIAVTDARRAVSAPSRPSMNMLSLASRPLPVSHRVPPGSDSNQQQRADDNRAGHRRGDLDAVGDRRTHHAVNEQVLPCGAVQHGCVVRVPAPGEHDDAIEDDVPDNECENEPEDHGGNDCTPAAEPHAPSASSMTSLICVVS